MLSRSHLLALCCLSLACDPDGGGKKKSGGGGGGGGDTGDVADSGGSGSGGSGGSGSGSGSSSGGCDGAHDRRYDCSGMDPADVTPLMGQVALTFDDGPNHLTTPAILETLREFQAPATFFVLGIELEDSRNWDVIDEIVEDPLFTLANHSYDHANQADLSLSAHRAQVDDTNDLIRSFGVEPEFFRFPYGSSNCDTADYVRSLDLRIAGWHIDTADWCYAAFGDVGECTRDDYWRIPEEYETDMLGFTMEQLERFDGGVVLYHDIHPYVADEMERTLQAMVDAGYTFVDLHDAGAFPNLNAGTPADLPFVGEACQTDNDLCWLVEYEAWCEPTDPNPDSTSTDGICTVPCEGYCLDRDGSPTTFCAEVAPGGFGQCTSRSQSLNDCCDALPGTVSVDMDRWVGDSSASDSVQESCVPESWL